MPEALRVFMIAGEASGDNLGGPLMRSLAAQSGRPVSFHGVGGPQMTAAGLASLFPMADLSVMGLAEVLPRLGLLRRRIEETADAIIQVEPDLVVTIDAPDFCFRVARKVQGQVGRKAVWVHYVAPSVWAWRPKRARKLARLYDGVLCLLPFEPSFFTAEGLRAAYVGHPASGEPRGPADGATFRRRHGIADDALALGVLFGSRVGEVERLGEILVDTLEQAVRAAPRQVHIVAPTLPHLRDRVEALLARLSRPVTIVTDDRWDAFAAMDAAMAVSGTVALELALSRVPHVIAYRMNPLTHAMLRRVVRVRFAHLANILLDRAAVPEFIQDNCRPERIAPALAALFDPAGPAAAEQRTAFAQLRQAFGAGDASAKAAAFALQLVRERA